MSLHVEIGFNTFVSHFSSSKYAWALLCFQPTEEFSKASAWRSAWCMELLPKTSSSWDPKAHTSLRTWSWGSSGSSPWIRHGNSSCFSCSSVAWLCPTGFQGTCNFTSSCYNGFGAPFLPVPAQLCCQSCEIASSHQQEVRSSSTRSQLNVSQITGGEVSVWGFSSSQQKYISVCSRQCSGRGVLLWRKHILPKCTVGNSHCAEVSACKAEEQRAKMIIRASWVVISMLYSQLLHWFFIFFFVMREDKSSRPYKSIHSSVKWLFLVVSDCHTVLHVCDGKMPWDASMNRLYCLACICQHVFVHPPFSCLLIWLFHTTFTLTWKRRD